MKNLDRRKAGAALVAEGLALIYGIKADSAGLLAKVGGDNRGHWLRPNWASQKSR